MLEDRAIAAEPLIRAEGLTKHFPVTRGLLAGRTTGHVKAVDGISFTIGHQETLGLVGESGCGKTTTSRLLLRLEQPTAGRVLLDGRGRPRASRRGSRAAITRGSRPSSRTRGRR